MAQYRLLSRAARLARRHGEAERLCRRRVRRWMTLLDAFCGTYLLPGQDREGGSAARRLGFRNRHAVSTQLANRHFSRNSARRWAAAFGFSERFLLTGEGPLLQQGGDGAAEKDDVRLHDVIRSLTAANEVLVRKLDEYERLYD